MATIAWKNAAGGDWWLADNWQSDTAPENGDDVTIGVAGDYTITVGPGEPGARIVLNSLTVSNADADLRFEAPGKIEIGTLAIDGTVGIGPQDHSLAAPIRVEVEHLENHRYLDLFGAVGSGPRATLVTQDTAPTVLDGGIYYLDGHTLVQFAGGGAITAIGADGNLDLIGNRAFIASGDDIKSNSALTGLSDNAGLLWLAGGVKLGNENQDFHNSEGGYYFISDDTTVKTNFDFVNDERVFLDYGTGHGGSRLLVGGTFFNNDLFYIGDPDTYVPTTARFGALENRGEMQIGLWGRVLQSSVLVRTDATNSGPVSVWGGGYVSAHTWTQTGGETNLLDGGQIHAKKLYIESGALTGNGSGLVNATVIVAGDGVLGGGTSWEDGLTIEGKLVVRTKICEVLYGPTWDTGMHASGGDVVIKGASLQLTIAVSTSLQVGDVFPILSFDPGHLRGQFAAITVGTNFGTHFGDGHSIDLGNGLELDAVYDNARGSITLHVVDAAEHLFVGADGSVSHDIAGVVADPVDIF